MNKILKGALLLTLRSIPSILLWAVALVVFREIKEPWVNFLSMAIIVAGAELYPSSHETK